MNEEVRRPDCDGGNDNMLSICGGSGTYDYEMATVAGATCYTWTAPTGCIIHYGALAGNPLTVNQSGGSEVEVKISFPAGYTGGDVTVQACNACSAGGIGTWHVTGNGCRYANTGETGNTFNVYPNPTSGKLNINFTASQKETYVLRIVDMLGNVVFSGVNVAEQGFNTQEIDLGSVAKGMYMLTIEVDGVETQKVPVVVN